MKILIAEDDVTSRKLLKMSLVNMGHDVVEAENGAEAWRLYQDGRFALVITDWEMPKFTGIQLCQAIRQAGRNHYTFVILLTVKGDKESLLIAFDAGADEFLSKPIDRAELIARVYSATRVIELETKLRERYFELDQAHRMIKKDLEAAARIQNSLLPNRESLNIPFEVAWDLIPCEELAGDIFNIIPLDKNRWGIYLLDVSGHGVASALMSVTLSRLLSPNPEHSVLFGRRGSTRDLLSPSQVLNLLNQQYQISEETGGQYFTMVYGIYNSLTMTFKYSSAGHPPLLLLNEQGDVVEIESRNLPIGFTEEGDYKDSIIVLRPNEQIVFYSDGVVEMPNPDNQLYGPERLADLLKTHHTDSTETVVQSIESAIQDWYGKTGSLPDDVSLLVLKAKNVVVPEISSERIQLGN